MQFTVNTDRPGKLEIHKLLEQHANDLWVPSHLTSEQAAGFVLDHFRRELHTELEMVQIETKE